MNDFLLRSVTSSAEFADCEGGKLQVTVTRSRSSNGYAGIVMDVNGKRVLDLTTDLESYEQAAFEIAKMLDAVASNPCTLPHVDGVRRNSETCGGNDV